MYFPSASPNANMNTPSNIKPTPARYAERASLCGEILASKVMTGVWASSSCSFMPGLKRIARLLDKATHPPPPFVRRRFKDVGARGKPGHDGFCRLRQSPRRDSDTTSSDAPEDRRHARLRSRRAPHGAA